MKFGDTLAWKQTRATVLAAISLGIVLSILLIGMDYVQTRKDIAISGQELLQVATSSATQAAYTLDAVLAREVLEGLFSVRAVSFGQVLTERGEPLAQLSNEQQGGAPWIARSLGEEWVFNEPLIWHNPHTDETQRVGELKLVVNGALAGADFQRRVIWEITFGIVRNLLLAIIILLISRRLLTHPLRQMVAELRGLEGFRPLTPLPRHDRDELGELVRAFNQMAGRLQNSRDEQQRLSQIMAHDFQEPARRLVSFAGRLQQKQDLTTDQDARQSIEFIAQQSARLSELLRAAQYYLSLDQVVLEDEAIALDRLLTQIAIEQKLDGDTLVLQGASLAAWMPYRRCHELFTALITNAVTYKHPKRPLRLRAEFEAQGERVQCRLIDNGTGIDPEYRQQALELFVRLLPVSQCKGPGLGLAMSSKLVRNYGGDLYLADGIEGGLAVIFDLPLAQSEGVHLRNKG